MFQLIFEATTNTGQSFVALDDVSYSTRKMCTTVHYKGKEFLVMVLIIDHKKWLRILSLCVFKFQVLISILYSLLLASPHCSFQYGKCSWAGHGDWRIRHSRWLYIKGKQDIFVCHHVTFFSKSPYNVTCSRLHLTTSNYQTRWSSKTNVESPMAQNPKKLIVLDAPVTLVHPGLYMAMYTKRLERASK